MPAAAHKRVEAPRSSIELFPAAPNAVEGNSSPSQMPTTQTPVLRLQQKEELLKLRSVAEITKYELKNLEFFIAVRTHVKIIEK